MVAKTPKGNFLFNIYNNYKTSRTEITFLGLKFKVYNANLTLIPDYSNVLKKIKEKYKNKEKIRVAFYVSENAKWNGEELYKLFEQHEFFEPIIIVSLLSYVHNGNDNTRNNLQENYEFFKSSGKNVVKAYNEEKKEYIPIEKFGADIIFYQQPWGIPDIHDIEYTKDFVLSCYFDYGISVLEEIEKTKHFLDKLAVYFIPNIETKSALEKNKKEFVDNKKIVGYPKLDIYNQLNKITSSKKTILYAPHLSYKKNSVLKIGTFDTTGKEILEYAKHHSEYNWIFKPHPALKHELYQDKKYGKEFADNYYKQWAEIGKIYDKGNYFEQFMLSDILITDCDSFLLEYMPTLNPIIRLERKDSVKLSKLGQEIVKGIYRVSNFDECVTILEKLDNPNQDELKEKRKEITDSILRKTTNASANIVAELEKLFIDSGVVDEK